MVAVASHRERADQAKTWEWQSFTSNEYKNEEEAAKSSKIHEDEFNESWSSALFLYSGSLSSKGFAYQSLFEDITGI